MSIPTTQKAVQLIKTTSDEKGARHTVAVKSVPVPQPKEGQVLVKLLGASFNRRDFWSLLGAYPGLTFDNATMGCDGAGVIVSGSQIPNNNHPRGLVVLSASRGWLSDVTGPEAELPGAPDSVLKNEFGGQGFVILGATKGGNGAGMFTEYIAVDPRYVLPAPRHLNAIQCATFPCAGVTAWRALFTKAKVQKGQNVLITGVGGGVAQLALQLAHAAGANVFVTGGSDAKLKHAKSLGAAGGASYRNADWPQEIRAQLPKSRAYLDAVVDSAGGDIAVQSIKAGLKTGGRVAVYGMTATPKINFTMREVLRNVELLGSTMGSNDELRDCLRFIEQHRIEPSIDTVLEGLDAAHRGFDLLENAEKRSAGKVVVRIAPESDTKL